MYIRDMKFNYSVQMRGAPRRDILDNLCLAAVLSQKRLRNFCKSVYLLIVIVENTRNWSHVFLRLPIWPAYIRTLTIDFNE